MAGTLLLEKLHQWLTTPTVALSSGDIELGAVELKNAADDTRVKVAATASVAEGDNALAVQAPVLGVTSGAALDADGSGTVQQYLRGLLKAFLARIPTLFTAAMMPIRTTTAIAPTAISATSAQAATMVVNGLYEMHSTVDCYYRQGASGGTAVTTDDLLHAGERILIYCSSAASNGFVQAVCDTGISGTLYLKQII